MFLRENNDRDKAAMRTLHRSILSVLVLAAPAGALAASGHGIAYQASAAAVMLWLIGLGWGFHAMLHHRLAAEDRLARLESDIAFERDARAAAARSTQQRLMALEAEWLRLEECLRDGDLHHVQASMRAVQGAILLLQETP